MNRERVKSMTRRAIKVSTYLMSPLMVGLAVCGEPIVRLILTDKWLPLLPYMTIFCITQTFLPINTANLNAIKAMGRSDLYLKLEILKKIVGLVFLLFTMNISIMAMAYSLLVSSFLSQIINSYPNKKLLNYSYLSQLKDIMPQLCIAFAMGGVVYCIKLFGLNDILTLLIQVPVGAIIYIAFSKIFHIDSFEYLINTVNGLFHRSKKKSE